MELLELLSRAMREFYGDDGRIEIKQSSHGSEVRLMRGEQPLVVSRSNELRQAIFDAADYWYSSVWRKR
jgi:hypothetical protein